MVDRTIDLANARVLVCNDDGIDAPGIKLLAKLAHTLAREVWVVAPEREQSGASHSLTLERPLRIRKLGPRRFAIDGTPTDCVLLAVSSIMRDHPPDLVLSGINAGSNLSEDVTYSGTVAAAMEATLLDVPAIAMSQETAENGPTSWATGAAYAPQVIRRLAEAGWPPNTLINVNFPGLPPDRVTGIAATGQGRRKIATNLDERIDPRGRAYIWIGPLREKVPIRHGTDETAIAEGKVTVTPIHLDLTHKAALAKLRKVFQ
jgi:5'-nucleotidase